MDDERGLGRCDVERESRNGRLPKGRLLLPTLTSGITAKRGKSSVAQPGGTSL
jgi:hypothetical protein